MIKINLLPQELAGGRASSSTASEGVGVVVLIVVLALALNAGLGFYAYSLQTSSRKLLAETDAEARKVKKELAETQVQYDEAKLSLERMRKLIEVATKLDPDDRLLWSRKLNALPLLVPEGVFLTEVSVTQKVTEKETEASIKARNEWNKKGSKKGTPPEVVKVPVFQQTLVLNGVAYVEGGTDTQRLDNIVRFNNNLQRMKVQLPFDKAPSAFLDGFVPIITLSPVTGQTLDGRDVTSFRFTINSKQLTFD